MANFFVSYNRADRNWAEWIAWQLEEAGYAVIIQAWDFRPGANFVQEMDRAAAQAERTLAVLSPDYLVSEFTAAEWSVAFARDPASKARKLLPVRVRECELRGLLSPIIYVDLVGKDEAAAKEALLAGATSGRGKPDAAPVFPGTTQRSFAKQPRFPGALPRVWNVPHQRNPSFTGRADLLDELHRTLVSGQATTLTQAITGLGGVGKTRLAVEYAYRQAADYDVVWWVKAEEPAALADDYAKLAAQLDLPEQNVPDQRVAIEAVRGRLEQSAGWLLIFDNAREAKAVRDYFPRGGGGHVLVTSRDPNWRGVAHQLSVKVLARAGAVDFLLRRTGQTDAVSAEALAAELGNLPLALEQAGAYIEATGKSLSAYLELFRTRQPELLRLEEPLTDYSATVAAMAPGSPSMEATRKSTISLSLSSGTGSASA